jgi:NADPH-dependent F420 reductase
MSNSNSATIAVIGGTGDLGSAIARRLGKAGRRVIIGSRSQENADAAAARLGFGLSGMDLAGAAQAADIIIVTVPFAAQETTLREIAPHVRGKIVVDTTVPLVPPRVMRVQLPDEGSAAVRAQGFLGEEVKVVSAFHNVAAHKLIEDGDFACDVLVFGDDKASRSEVIELVRASGLRGIHAGALVNSVAAEALTSILIFINKAYSVDGAGIQITGTLVEP